MMDIDGHDGPTNDTYDMRSLDLTAPTGYRAFSVLIARFTC